MQRLSLLRAGETSASRAESASFLAIFPWRKKIDPRAGETVSLILNGDLERAFGSSNGNIKGRG